MSRSVSEIETWLRSHVATVAGIYADEVDLETPFTDLGLDSVTGLELLGALGDWLGGDELAPTVIIRHNSIKRLAAHVVK